MGVFRNRPLTLGNFEKSGIVLRPPRRAVKVISQYGMMRRRGLFLLLIPDLRLP